MLQLRLDQVGEFDRAARDRFAADQKVHLRAYAGPQLAGVGDADLRRFIDRGTAAAARYGFTLRGPVEFFLECMLMFGWQFDTDPMLPWAAYALGGGASVPEMARADELHAAAVGYRTAVAGPEFELEKAAVGRLLATPVPAWLAMDPRDESLRGYLKDVWPERYAAAGPTGIGAALAGGRAGAAAHGLGPAGGVVFTALLFAFGHGCATDPAFGWIPKTLADSTGADPRVRTEKLAVRACGFLAASLG